MKKLLKNLLIAALCFSMIFSFTACSDDESTDISATSTPTANSTDNESADNTDNGNTAQATTPTPDTDKNQTPSPTEVPTNAIKATAWQVTELSFNTSKKYVTVRGEQGKVIFDGVFTHKASGTTLTIPGFWDGDNVFKLRFAPTKTGVWEYKTLCKTDDSLNGKTGTINVSAYTGNLEVYKHGFVKTDPNKKYFVYDDGTPFFYLGDTHWAMLREEFDSAGDHAGNIKTDSHFKYIVDKRVSQGYTVYQSQPIAAEWSLVDGKIGREDLVAFQKADKYFQYLAEKGLTHANAQFFFSNDMLQFKGDDQTIRELARYWVARFGAYPVMWTLAQEIDNDYYYERGSQSHTKYNDNPWLKIAECINECDAYNHPLSGHQEGYPFTTVTGKGTTDPSKSNGGKSIFLDESVSKRTGHDWWASSTGVSFKEIDEQFEFAKDYWASNKVAVLYEGLYCYLWTKDFGARAQGWRAFLNGFFGYGYGAIDMWQYKSTYNTHVNSSDGVDTITKSDKLKTWSEAIEFESGYQVGYMKQFFQKIEWWKLVPDFDAQKYFKPSSHKDYTCATNGSDVYVLYLFNRSTASGQLKNMNNSATYTVKWFNPRTNEYKTISTSVKPTNATYTIPTKPDAKDWVVIATKN